MDRHLLINLSMVEDHHYQDPPLVPLHMASDYLVMVEASDQLPLARLLLDGLCRAVAFQEASFQDALH